MPLKSLSRFAQVLAVSILFFACDSTSDSSGDDNSGVGYFSFKIGTETTPATEYQLPVSFGTFLDGQVIMQSVAGTVSVSISIVTSGIGYYALNDDDNFFVVTVSGGRPDGIHSTAWTTGNGSEITVRLDKLNNDIVEGIFEGTVHDVEDESDVRFIIDGRFRIPILFGDHPFGKQGRQD